MIRIALTGPSGSGKSTLLSLLEEKGCGIIDCDVVVHELQIPGERCYEELVEAFGTGILRSDSGIDRIDIFLFQLSYCFSFTEKPYGKNRN